MTLNFTPEPREGTEEDRPGSAEDRQRAQRAVHTERAVGLELGRRRRLLAPKMSLGDGMRVTW